LTPRSGQYWPTTDVVRGIAARLQLDVVQLHGSESVRDVALLRDAGLTVWKAVSVRSADDVMGALSAYGDVASALLLDGHAPGAAGGTGMRFDWSAVAPLHAQWPSSLDRIAAGGLHDENVSEVIAALHPDIVDVSSGVEAALCVKSPEKVRKFIAAARAAAAEKATR
jgi:phosphoribosylanthranilate isomerase